MSAYHHQTWADFYDAWVSNLFKGNESNEDIDVFLHQLDLVERNRKGNESASANETPCTIVEIGTGTGRVVRELYKQVSNSLRQPSTKRADLKYLIIGTEPSIPMLDRAEALWDEFYVHEANRQLLEHIEVKWQQASATDFASKARLLDSAIAGPHTSSSYLQADLIIFAAGGVSHLASIGEVQVFISQLSQSLRSTSSRVVISVLKEFYYGKDAKYEPIVADEEEYTTDARHGQQDQDVSSVESLQRITDPSNKDRIFMKHPTHEVWDAAHEVRTDTFKLTIEDAGGKTVETCNLEWQMRIVSLGSWESMLKENGLQVDQIVEGSIQVWLIIGRIE